MIYSSTTMPLHQAIRSISIAAIILTGAVTGLTQTSADEFARFLRHSAAFTEDDFSALRTGDVVVRTLAAQDKREVAVVGVLQMKAPAQIVLEAFGAGMRQMDDKSLLAVGQFSDVPVLDDLKNLTLEDQDVEDLKQCVVGKCELKLSSEMIKRFQHEMNWTAPDYQRQATGVFQEMLLDYVRDYRARGDAALIEYHDQPRPVSLREEQQAHLARTVYINDFAPEFASYLKSFPDTGFSNVETSISWTKLKFGLKPAIIITHVSTYSRPAGNSRQQIVSVAKQIYANHYFDSSLAVTAVVNIPASEGASDTYLLYTNHSRADALAGSMSRLRRGLVESEAVENLRNLLQQTRTNVEVIYANQSQVPIRSGKEELLESLFAGTRVLWWLTGLVAIVALMWISRRKYWTVTGDR